MVDKMDKMDKMDKTNKGLVPHTSEWFELMTKYAPNTAWFAMANITTYLRDKGVQSSFAGGRPHRFSGPVADGKEIRERDKLKTPIKICSICGDTPSEMYLYQNNPDDRYVHTMRLCDDCVSIRKLAYNEIFVVWKEK